MPGSTLNVGKNAMITSLINENNNIHLHSATRAKNWNYNNHIKIYDDKPLPLQKF